MADNLPGAGTGTATPPASGTTTILPGTDVTIEKPAAQPRSTIDLTTKIKTEDGEFTVAELAAVKRESVELKQDQEALRTLFAKGDRRTPEEEKKVEAAYRRGLSRAGYTEEEIVAELEKLEIGADNKDPKKGETAAAPPPTSRAVQGLFRDRVNEVLEGALGGNAELKELMVAVGAHNSTEDAAGFKENITMGLRQELGRRLTAKMQAEGVTRLEDADPAWVRELMPEAAKAVTKQYAPLVKTVKALGKSQAAAANPFGNLPEKPKEAPRFVHGVTQRSSFDDQMSEFLVDALSRGVVESGAAA